MTQHQIKGSRLEGIPPELAEQQREERKERDRLEAERIRELGRELCLGPIRVAEQLLGEWEREQIKEENYG